MGKHKHTRKHKLIPATPGAAEIRHYLDGAYRAIMAGDPSAAGIKAMLAGTICRISGMRGKELQHVADEIQKIANIIRQSPGYDPREGF